MNTTILQPTEKLEQPQSSFNSTIKSQPRQGWEEAAKRAHKNGDDQLLIPDVFEDEKFEDWTW